MKKLSVNEAIEAGLNVQGANEERAKEDIVLALQDCGYDFYSEDDKVSGQAIDELERALTKYRKHAPIVLPVKEGSELARKYGCKEWDWTNGQPVSEVKTQQLSKEEIANMYKEESAKMSKPRVFANPQTEPKKEEKPVKREERKKQWVRENNNNKEESVNMNALDKLNKKAAERGIKVDEPKARQSAKNTKFKLRESASVSKSVRNSFWYREFEGAEVSGEFVAVSGDTNLKYEVLLDEPTFGVVKVLLFESFVKHERVVCDLIVELDNGLSISGFRVWEGKDGDGSLYLSAPSFSYIPRDKDEAVYSSHVKLRDRENKRVAPGFEATLLNIVDGLVEVGVDDEAAYNDEDEE